MDNEAPNYAQWINEAGGYVANGNVVSRSPIYEEDGSGRMKIKVDTSVFGSTQPQNSSSGQAQPQAQPQVANTLTGNAGVTTANIQGSGTDANAAATQLGSMTTLENNLGKAQDSALSSPATRSIVAGKTILSPEDAVNKEYQDAVARGDFQGQINALTKASRITGTDYSAEIQDLTKQRQQKIQGMDDQYLQAINDAKAIGDQTGDYTDYNALLQEQENWRNAVGYREATAAKYQADLIDLDIEYKDTYLQATKDIASQLVQALPGILNFQYDPFTDRALNIAQGYATSRVKEQMNATGMYYSSMTQGAIAKAVGELVPVYEKMARDEAIQNFNLLQQTANFLMDLEQTQFNMWKGQIQLKFDANAEKRAQVDQAIQNANARGYYTNEEAALLGVEPGTPSYESRTRALDKQDQIEKEQRQLEQSMALAEFNSALAVQEYEQKQAIAAQYEVATYSRKKAIEARYGGSDTSTPGGTGDGTDGSSDIKMFGPIPVRGDITFEHDFSKKLSGKATKSDIKTNIQNSATQAGVNEYSQLIWLENALESGKNYDDVWSAISQAQVDQFGTKYGVYDQMLLNSFQGNSADKLSQLYQFLKVETLGNQNSAPTNGNKIVPLLAGVAATSNK